ncbi:hypothetical protein BG004_004918 [Podila humilis]|nr:hypothetical protein BG004_004918 [Podila humilis]
MASLPPEIIVYIVAFIARKDLFQCAVVSKAWFNIFGPKIWREVVLYRLHSGDLLMDPLRLYYFRAGLVRNGHLVQTFWSDFYAALDLIVVDAPPFPVEITFQNCANNNNLDNRRRVLCRNLSNIYLGDSDLLCYPETCPSSPPSPSLSSSSATMLSPPPAPASDQPGGLLSPTTPDGHIQSKLASGSPPLDILDALTTMALTSPTAISFHHPFSVTSLSTRFPLQHCGRGLAPCPRTCANITDLLIQVLKENPGLKGLDVRAPLLTGQGESWRRLRCVVPGVLRSILDACPPGLQELALWSLVPEDNANGFPEDVDEDYAGRTQVEYESHEERSALLSCGCHADTLPMDSPANEFVNRMALNSIDIVHPVGDFSALTDFLARCPNLESIYLRELGKDFQRQEFSTVLRKHCRHLSRLEIDCFRDETDEDIAHMINSSFSGLKYLRFDSSDGFGPLATQALLRHSHSMEQLIVPDCGGFHSKDIQRFLTYAPNLWNFEGTTSNEYNRWPIDLRLSAQDLISSKWACQQLQRLALVIDHIPRPLIQSRHDGRPFSEEFMPVHLKPGQSPISVSDSWSLQQEVYRQLGSLHRLEELILGHVMEPEPRFIMDEEDYQDFDGLTHRYVARGYQYECLEFSLESGLDLLSGLKQLRVLNVTRMTHRIGVRELEWMHVNWPNLKNIVGLTRRPYSRTHSEATDADNDVESLEDDEADVPVAEGNEMDEFEVGLEEKELDGVRAWVERHPYGIGSSFSALQSRTA